MDTGDTTGGLPPATIPEQKTPERTAGVIKLRGGGGEETSKPQNAKKQGNAG